MPNFSSTPGVKPQSSPKEMELAAELSPLPIADFRLRIDLETLVEEHKRLSGVMRQIVFERCLGQGRHFERDALMHGVRRQVLLQLMRQGASFLSCLSILRPH